MISASMSPMLSVAMTHHALMDFSVLMGHASPVATLAACRATAVHVNA